MFLLAPLCVAKTRSNTQSGAIHKASSTIQVEDEYYWCSNLKIEAMLWHS